LTNRGLRIEKCSEVYKSTIKSEREGAEITTYHIAIGYRRGSVGRFDFDMLLRKAGPDVFLRIGNLLHDCDGVSRKFIKMSMPQFFIQTDNLNTLAFPAFEQELSLYIPKHKELQIQNVVPESHWDESRRRLFFKPERADCVLALACKLILGGSSFWVTICFDFRGNVPHSMVFSALEYPEQSQWLLRSNRRAKA
jgi:hypothetical protein